MSTHQLSEAAADSARRLASHYLPSGYRGPLYAMPAAIRHAQSLTPPRPATPVRPALTPLQ